MSLVVLARVGRRVAGVPLFEDVSLSIERGDRIGVVGDNGAGKTSLLRVLLGIDPPDEGERRSAKGLATAYAPQIPEFAGDPTLVEAVLEGAASLRAAARRIAALEAKLEREPGDRQALAELGRLQADFEAARGWDLRRRAEALLSGLGFAPADCGRRVGSLSGGERTRVNLARALIAPADLLVLDEPTNHLDLDGTAFLEAVLAERRGAFVVVSHDREFLERSVSAIVEVEGGRVRRYRGTYSAYRARKELEIKTLLRERKKQEDFVAKELAFVRRHISGRRAAEAKGRLKRLARLERITAPRTARRRMGVRFEGGAGLAGASILEGEDVCFAHPGGPPLFEHADFRIQYGDRIGLVGRNGAGKSTFLRLLEGSLLPTEGRITRARRLEVERLAQDPPEPPPGRTLLALLAESAPALGEGELRAHLARFLFPGDEVEKEARALSGGERRRFQLARFVLEPADLLLLDEPTNHLDFATQEALEEALAEYPGTVVTVSHDRWFLRRFAGRIFELRDGRLSVFDGGLDAWLAAAERRRSERPRVASGRRQPRTNGGSAPSTSVRRPGKIRNPWAFERLERTIIALEEEAAALDEEAAGETAWRDPERMRRIKARKREIAAELERLYEEWENWQ